MINKESIETPSPRNATVHAPFGGDNRVFRLPLPKIYDLQDELKISFAKLFRLFAENDFGPEHVRSVLRHALLGGGKIDTPFSADRIVDQELRDGNLMPCAVLATACLSAAWYMDPKDPVGKGLGEGTRKDDEPFSAAAVYGTAAAIGISTSELNNMSMWEFIAAVDGWNKVHGGEQKTPPPTPEEFDAVKRAHGMH